MNPLFVSYTALSEDGRLEFKGNRVLDNPFILRSYVSTVEDIQTLENVIKEQMELEHETQIRWVGILNWRRMEG